MIHTPLVAMANHYQFSPGHVVEFPSVESRMLLWCKEGGGVVWVNGRDYRLEKDDFLFLPWRHSIMYVPDGKKPFLVGGVHLIPAHDASATVVFDVAHFPSNSLYGVPERSDGHVVGTDAHGTLSGRLTERKPLEMIAEYAVTVFQRGIYSVDVARYLGHLMVEELSNTINDRFIPDGIPAPLAKVLQTVRQSIKTQITLRELSQMMGRSPATVTRLFREYLGTSPNQWILRLRMETAAKLLMTTGMKVRDIGGSVGIDDPYYFSKLFRRFYGRPPKEYRRCASMIRATWEE